MCSQTVINDITQRIAQEARRIFGDLLDKIYLYGPNSQGFFDTECDVEMLVIANIRAEDALGMNRKLLDLASDLDLEYEVFIMVDVRDSETFYNKLSRLPDYRDLIQNGIEIVA
jgi:hypothetical protein